MRSLPLAACLSFAALLSTSAAWAEDPSFNLLLKDHRFTPAEITVPANTKVRFVVKNLDTTPAEFESKDFKAEKVIPAGATMTVMIPALKPGTYGFFDEFHEATAKGRVIAK